MRGERRNDEGYATCCHHLLVVAFGQFGGLFTIVRRDADDRPFIGGETATEICTWIYKTFVPIVIKTSTILILFGLATMYLAGEKALTPDKRNAKTEGEK